MNSAWTIGALLAVTASPASSAPADEAFLGCWRTDSVTTRFPDGRERVGHPQCFQLNEASKISTVCRSDSMVSRLQSSYVIVAPGIVETVITEHSAKPDLVGSKNRHRYVVSGNHLMLSTDKPADGKNPASEAITIVGEATRIEGRCPALETPTGSDPVSTGSDQKRSPTGK